MNSRLPGRDPMAQFWDGCILPPGEPYWYEKRVAG